MELNILEETKTKLVMDVNGEGHTLCNLLKKELWKNKHVKAAGYHVNHPLVGTPRFVVETDGENPKEALIAAAKSMKKNCDGFLKVFAKEAK
ncbi:DNA-directed RNA polymerase subunit L [Candidatus Woesearchaeota archaeon]|nr:DNA-directed RNA polymerase subunit L [Candidatus Woesearchaeota archaeon]